MRGEPFLLGAFSGTVVGWVALLSADGLLWGEGGCELSRGTLLFAGDGTFTWAGSFLSTGGSVVLRGSLLLAAVALCWRAVPRGSSSVLGGEVLFSSSPASATRELVVVPPPVFAFVSVLGPCFSSLGNSTCFSGALLVLLADFFRVVSLLICADVLAGGLLSSPQPAKKLVAKSKTPRDRCCTSKKKGKTSRIDMWGTRMNCAQGSQWQP